MNDKDIVSVDSICIWADFFTCLSVRSIERYSSSVIALKKGQNEEAGQAG